MNYLRTEQQLNDERNAKLVECVKNACKFVHITQLAKQKTEKARIALKFDDKLLVWNILQEYLCIYREFINSLSIYTGIIVYDVDSNFFDNCTIFDIKQQIENIIAFVYLKEALSSVAKESFKQCLKKMLKQTGLFTEVELSFI